MREYNFTFDSLSAGKNIKFDFGTTQNLTLYGSQNVPIEDPAPKLEFECGDGCDDGNLIVRVDEPGSDSDNITSK